MGTQCASTFANIFMGELETKPYSMVTVTVLGDASKSEQRYIGHRSHFSENILCTHTHIYNGTFHMPQVVDNHPYLHIGSCVLRRERIS